MTSYLTATARHHHTTARPETRLVRLFAIIVVFAMGAAFALPTPAAAQIGGTVSGAVVDSDGGALSGAEVVLKMRVNGSLWSYHEATTDDAGGFTFSGLEPGTWQLAARLDGYRTNETEVALSAGGSEKIEVALVSLTERAYAGRVLSADDETPIIGALITVRGYSDDTDGQRTTTSDTDGKFRVRLFAYENQITIERSGYGTYRDWVYQPNGIIERDIYLHTVPPQSATVTGKVVDGEGNPIQAHVSLYPRYDEECCVTYDRAPSPHYNHHNNTVTDENGSFTMKAYPGKITVQADRQGFLVASKDITLDEDGTQQVTFTLLELPPRSVTLNGKVVDGDGEPVEGASVNIQVPAAGDHAWVSTDKDGTYTAKVRPGYTLIEVSRWGHCCVMYAEAVSSDGGSENASSASMRLPDRSQGDGKEYLPASRTLTTTAGANATLDITLQQKPDPATTVVGYVIDSETGKAVPGAQVSLQNHATGDWGQAVTDENGSYKFQAYGGYHTVRVWHDGHLPYSTNAALADSGSERLDLTVTPGRYAQEGWWSPDGHKGGGYDDGPRPMPARTSAMAEDSSMAGGGMASDGDSRSFEAPSGDRSYTGSGGGLPAYDPGKTGETFGAGETAESPVSPLMAIVLALGALAVVAGMRRER